MSNNKKIVYLTMNDAPSGVYKSQVIDVVDFLNSRLDLNIKLVSFVPLRGFLQNRRKLKAWNNNIKVLPMFPKLSNWKRTKSIYNLFAPKGDLIIARGPMAFEISHNKDVLMIYDGRGAIKAELNEYPDMIPDRSIVNNIINAEKFAVLNSNKRLAVSHKLVDYWKREFNLPTEDSSSIVIPCLFTAKEMSKDLKSKTDLGWSEKDIVLVYAGGIGGWQSFEPLMVSLIKLLGANNNIKCLFLTRENEYLTVLMSKFPKKVKRLWLNPEEVPNYLSLGDYGILVREKNITNEVASPVKYAEYLNAGLKVLISEGIGDFSNEVMTENLGIVIRDFQIPENLKEITADEKERIIAFGNKYSKENFLELYKNLLG